MGTAFLSFFAVGPAPYAAWIFEMKAWMLPLR